MADVTLQINLAPPDYRYAQHILPHQLDVWYDQVDEVLFTCETRRSAGRFGSRWEEFKERLDTLLEALSEQYPATRTVGLDYSSDQMAEVARFFFDLDEMPPKDFRGGPFYAYFFGLHAAQHPHVLHLDADMLFGGQSASWMAEALRVLQQNPNVLSVSPHPGPPRRDAESSSPGRVTLSPEQKPFRITPRFTTRVFLMDRRRLVREGPLPLERPSVLGVLKARLLQNSPGAVPEDLIQKHMREHDLRRVQMTGTPPGMWSLHPRYRNEEFYRTLPTLIDRVDRGNIPDAQRGSYDIQDVLCDFSAERARDRWWRRGTRTLTAPLRRWWAAFRSD
jgi:hypothetical protein